MTHRKRQEEKSRKRKTEARQKISLRRTQIRADAKKYREEEKASQEQNKMTPIRRNPTQALLDEVTLNSVPNSITDYVPSMTEIRDKLIMDRLQHNVEILKKLGEEYEAELAQKEALKAEKKEDKNSDSQS